MSDIDKKSELESIFGTGRVELVKEGLKVDLDYEPERAQLDAVMTYGMRINSMSTTETGQTLWIR